MVLSARRAARAGGRDAEPIYSLPMKFAVVTFGCRVNQADSFALERGLRAAGRLAGGGRDGGPRRRQQLLGHRERRPGDAAGDPAHRPHQRRRPHRRHRLLRVPAPPPRVAALPGVVAVVPNAEKEALAERILDTAGDDHPRSASAPAPAPAAPPSGPASGAAPPTPLRVQTGCDEACAYCIIPSTRGRGRSVPLPRVLDEVGEAVDAGYRELQLTGVHLGSYGPRPDALLVARGAAGGAGRAHRPTSWCG